MTQQRIPELDGLRGVAILLVILDHYVGVARHAALGVLPHRALAAFGAGWTGVDLFFVLSGFLIGGILLDARSAPRYFRAFYVRRVYRILPVYYSWILIYGVLIGAALWFFPGRYPIASSSVLQVPVQLLFLQNLQLGMPAFAWTWFAVTWSLAIEEQFYLLAPPLIRFLSSRQLITAMVGTICIAPVLRLMLFRYWMPGTVAASFLMPCRADALGFGILLAVAWRADSVRAFLAGHPFFLKRTLLGLFAGVAVLFWWLVHPVSIVTVTIGFTWIAMFYTCLVLLAITQTEGVLARVLRWRFLRALGTISYCVYILHFAVNRLAHQLILHDLPQLENLRGAGVTIFALATTLGVAALSWRYFEKPLISRAHSYSYWEERHSTDARLETVAQ